MSDMADLGQSKKRSLAESVTNQVVGYVIALASQFAIFPLFGIHVSVMDNIVMCNYFTVISVVRGYVIRRWFNRRDH